MPQDRRRVAVIANRDREQVGELVHALGQRGASVVELPVGRDLGPAREADLVMLKVTTDPANRDAFQALRTVSVRHLNSLRSVKLCQSRRATFAFLNRRAPAVATPRKFLDAGEARRAIAEGDSVWVRRDAHNIPLGERVLGVARTPAELRDLTGGHRERTLFFQQYLGAERETYKAYVIGTHVVVCQRTAARVDFVAMADDVAQTLLRVGHVFAMSVYGIDFFYVDGRVVVLDVNDFPSFRGIPGASHRICEFVAKTFLERDDAVRRPSDS
jgi:ribosomal protein S6--L-glutamate ligase